MAVAVSPTPDASALTAPERALARWLRLFAGLFALGTLAFLLRPDDTVRNLDRVGSLLGFPTLAPSRVPVASDFWLALAVANMATITVCAWLAAGDVGAGEPSPIRSSCRSWCRRAPGFSSSCNGRTPSRCS